MPAIPEHLLALGVGVVSGLVPVINIEAYLLTLTLAGDGGPPWLQAVLAGAGQVAGKLVYFYAGRGSLRLPAFLRRWAPQQARADKAGAQESGPETGHETEPETGQGTGPGDERAAVSRLRRVLRGVGRAPGMSTVVRWGGRAVRRLAVWRARAEQRPRWCMAVLGVSAFTGLPPYGVMSAVAGGLRLSMTSFLIIGVPARCTRLVVVVLAPGVVSGVMGHLGGG